MATATANSPVRDLQHVTVYRDPAGEWNAAFPEMAQLANGDLLVSFREARYGPPQTGAGHNHSEPRCRGSLIRSADGGRSWPLAGRQQLTGTFPMEQCSVSAAGGDLVLFIYALNILQTRPLAVTVRGGEAAEAADWSAGLSCIDFARRSLDGGRSWDQATPLTPAPLTHSAIHAPMIELADGTLLAPLCGSLGADPSAPQQHPQCVVRSHDRGMTWGDGSIVALDPRGRRRYHQASLVPMPDGEIVAVMHSEETIGLADGREAREVNAWLARSGDAGRTWSELESLPFRITGSATSTIRLRDGRLLFTWSDRHIPSIRIAVSDDGGRSWSDAAGWSVRDGEHIPGSNSLLQAWTHDGSVFGGTYSDIGERVRAPRSLRTAASSRCTTGATPERRCATSKRRCSRSTEAWPRASGRRVQGAATGSP